jgi:predicted SnoaL-like aldol condensation-catalyzing enzyme
MKKLAYMLSCALVSIPLFASAGEPPVTANPNHEAMLQSKDPQLAKNKRVVYDFWRVVVEAGHLDQTEKYTTAEYIQHNPNVASGRQALIDFFAKSKKPVPIKERVETPIVAITAEGDYVALALARELPDPKDKTRKYTTTGLTLFRMKDGKINEHWDPATKNPD